jgi:Heavy metal associated domain 2
VSDTAPTEVLELIHHHPGRLRVRAAALRDDGERFERLSRALDETAGILAVTHNPRTGSVLVEYEPGLVEPDAIALRMAEAAELISPFDPRAAKPVFRPAGAVIEGTRELNAIAHELTGGRLDLRSIVPAALAGAAAYSFAFGPGPRLPRWDNLLWWSYSVFASLHAREVADAVGATAPAKGLELP